MIDVVANRYAQALFEVGEESGKLDVFDEELKAIVDILIDNKDFYEALKSPLIQKYEKKTLLQNVFSNNVNIEILNFLSILVDKDRISMVDKIYEGFKALLNKKNNIIEAVAITAIAMKDEMLEKLRERLSEMTKKTVILKNEVNENVIGGVLIRLGNEEIDGTVKGRLEKLKEELSQVIA
ncbi:MAG TPA: F0F1 ATP synthase subunit delta [Peptostreptococcaceae bacterium]|nr:F0F1 ATP synthase subunit delta [Peptostreptococcaceae bacterium]